MIAAKHVMDVAKKVKIVNVLDVVISLLNAVKIAKVAVI